MSFSADLYPILGRAYGIPALKELKARKHTAFSQLINSLQVSTKTLSDTLKSLVENGYVVKASYGRQTYYSITDKGLDILEEFLTDEDASIQRIVDGVIARLENIDAIPSNHDRGEVRDMVVQEVQAFIEDLQKKIGRVDQ